MSKIQESIVEGEATEEVENPHIDIVIIGTGFSGLGMAIKLKQNKFNDFVLLEKAADVGGTWRDNTYPGCACDVPSHLYSFSFAPNPNWSRSYSPQPEIWAYLRECANRFGVMPHIRWQHEMQQAHWHEDEQQWYITTNQGTMTARVLIMGNGPLSEPAMPNIPGIDSFNGTIFHSAQWNHEHDLHGERVAVIGTGASAIQFVPEIQPLVKSLLIFQRTPAWIMPRNDHPIAEWQKSLYRSLPLTQRAVRTLMYLQREVIAYGFSYRPSLIKNGEKEANKHLQAQIADPELRQKMTPNYAMGCKRVLTSDRFYPAISQPNVSVITHGVSEIRENAVVADDGQVYEVDTIICGTGFHVTDNPMAAIVYGRDNQSLADAWQHSPEAYLGACISGFPNLFMLIGPNTGLGHTSMVVMIESQLAYIIDGLKTMREQQIASIDVLPAIMHAYNDFLQQRMGGTVWNSGCASWYIDSNGRNTTIWPGFTWDFRRRTATFDFANYASMRSPSRLSSVIS